MNYFLALHHHPPVTIHQEDRGAYFAALKEWDRSQQIEPLRAFLREQTAKTWETQISSRLDRA